MLALTGELAFQIEAVETHCLRVPVSKHTAASREDAMDGVPALIVVLRFDDGAEGYGEVHCTLPRFSQFHKARIIDEILSPLLVGRWFGSPEEMTAMLEAQSHAIVVQSGEPGPFAHAIAGLDIAAWDGVSRRLDLPLWRLFTTEPRPATLPAYASGLDAADLETLVPPLIEAGWRAFKLKVGGDAETDRRNIDRLRTLIGPEGRIMVDANQAWDFATAERQITALAGCGLSWIEDPIAADRSWDEWSVLTAIGPPIALGGNLRGPDAFHDAIDAGAAVVQPDAMVWGGLSGARTIAETASEAGVLWAPHAVAGGIGLAATSHLTAALGGAYLEVDVHPHPLRDKALSDVISIDDGMVKVSDAPGTGYLPSASFLETYRASASA
ncbi:MAG: mandelate racemase/muconate lactonizing enzyme family protein [Pseudomonadota bacterium]